jgi:hypothetical protein
LQSPIIPWVGRDSAASGLNQRRGGPSIRREGRIGSVAQLGAKAGLAGYQAPLGCRTAPAQFWQHPKSDTGTADRTDIYRRRSEHAGPSPPLGWPLWRSRLFSAAATLLNHDQLKVELVEPDTMPAMVRIVWPDAPTVVDPKRFPDVAAAIAQLFARAHIVLAAIRAERKL